MRQKFFQPESKYTAFVGIDTKKCEACWECINICPQHVIGRINLPWHKHAKFVNGSECVGCMKCVKTCPAKAIVNLSKK